MRIRLLTKGLTMTELDTLNQGIVKLQTLLPQLQFTHQTTTANFNSQPVSNAVVTGVVLNASQLLSLVDGTDDIVCLVYDWTLITPQPTNPATSLIKKGNTIPMAIPKQWYANFPDTFVQFFLHELSHAESFRYGKYDATHDFYTSTYSQKSPTDYYLFLLKGILGNTPQVTSTSQTYKYFSQKEVDKYKLVPELWQLLDKMRGECGFPFIINSGFRTKEQNDTLLGSVEDSAHLTGEAVDLKIDLSEKRLKLIKIALSNGVNRIGVGKTFVHIDISKTLPQSVIWLYN
jgi:hypothetical protein